jgi:prepilin-type N-terminal cleavage/methylation domain-containing protein/prepilin-type processing-associated H-X9-DG protein
MKSPTHRPRPGFTLVELLVVITIIAVLAALTVVGFTRMRAAGDRATTVAVLRQLQIANVGYASDHNGQYVPMESYDEDNARGNEWHYSPKFLAYLTGDTTALDNKQTTTMAPASILDPLVVRAKKRAWNWLFASYGYNQQGMPSNKPNSDKSFKVSQVTNPSRSAAFVTATDWKVVHASRFRWLDNPVEGKSTDQKMAYRHGGKAIVVYYDGSSGLVSPEDIRAFDKKGGANHPFWNASQ